MECSSSSLKMSQQNPHLLPCCDLLPEEIVNEILIRLPCKPLCRFKCISKYYNSLISNPQFITSYISSASPPPTNWAILKEVNIGSTQHSNSNQFDIVDRPNISTFRSNALAIIHNSSNGLVLYFRSCHIDPYNEHLIEKRRGTLYVSNPVTREWVPLPEPTHSTGCYLGFTTRLDPTTCLVDKVMVVAYNPIVGSDYASLLCFSSDTGKWVTKSANYMLGMHSWITDGSYEFGGMLFWVDLSTGLIFWDAPGNDPFVSLDSKETAVCRFIPIPNRCARPREISVLAGERHVDVGGGCVQYMEVFKEENCMLKVWRLKDCYSGEWSLKYKVFRDDVGSYLPCDFSSGMPIPCFVHPFEADIVYFTMDGHIFSLNVQTHKVTHKVESGTSFNGCFNITPFLVQKWPSPLPKRLYAAYAKEKGNEFFVRQNFTEAIIWYSKSIELSPNSADFAKRAEAYLKVNKFREAENDFTESLQLDANYFYAYRQRALARKELGNIQGALEDVELGLKLKPRNKQMKKLYAEIKTMLEKTRCAGQEDSEKGEACDVALANFSSEAVSDSTL